VVHAALKTSDTSAVSVVDAASLPEEVMARIRGAVERPRFWCILPSPVDRLFADHRQESFVRMVLVGWPLLMLLLAVVALGSIQLFGADLTGRDSLLWWKGLGTITAILALATLALHVPVVQRRYQGVIVAAGCLTLAIPLAGSLVMESERLTQSASYFSILIIAILVLVMKLSLRMAALACGLGIALSAGMTQGMNVPVEWALFAWHVVGSFIVILAIAAVQERQERFGFLQGLLLAYESAERKHLNAVLERLASEDQLTGLPNRRVLNSVLLREWERASRTRKSMALLFMDVDYFKRYNDSLGHLAGDDCLAAIARVLIASLRRPADLAARYGGEEFVVLLPETEADGAMDVAQRILSMVDASALPHPDSAVASHVTISIVVAVMVPEGKRPQLLIDAADAALYEAKGRGRHQIVLAP
jgi:diguanylate cyclase (GGDEF)-like protein